MGNTGYVYALEAKEGVNLIDQKDSDGHEFIKEIITSKNGTIRYPWMNASLGDKVPREKVVVYSYYKD